MPNLKAHAAAIQAAINAAQVDGCYLDNGEHESIGKLELNEFRDDLLVDWTEIRAEGLPDD